MSEELDMLTALQMSLVDDVFAIESDEDDDVIKDDDDEQPPVMLGFLEKPNHNWSLLRHLFPSKAGGNPAWLDPINLPSEKSCLCDICSEPLQFMLQAYAPLSAKESTFHRTLFIFMCPKMSCLIQDQQEQSKHHLDKPSRSIKVFRCQLPRYNEFYSPEPPVNNGSDTPLGTGVRLCNWCDTWKGDKVCSKCKTARYCSKNHQAHHWSVAHKNLCGTSDNGSISASMVSWPEYEIINEDESDFDKQEEKSNAFEMSKNDLCRKALGTDNEDEEDTKSWAYFQRRILRAPDQVLRYSMNDTSKPLWPMSSGQPSEANIPKCNSCSKNRTFEFQILPQLLYYFDVKNNSDSLDWATIVVYTCEDSCDGNSAYKEEFAWVQLNIHNQDK